MKKIKSSTFCWLVSALMLTVFTAAQAYQAHAETPEFIQYVDEPGNNALQVSIVRYQSRTGGGQTVDLVGAVHVADQQYYQELNDMFKQYDVVLYELVAPEGTYIPKGGMESTGTLSKIQMGLKDLLGLSYQMEEVDYTAKHFVHADFTPAEFQQSMDEKGESIFSMVFNMWRASLSQQLSGQSAASDLELLMALVSSDRQNALKTVMAKELANSTELMQALEGSEGSTIVAERNKKALQVLQKEMAKNAQSFSIIYGAAHLADFHQRLVNDFALVPTSTRWVNAWQLH